MCVGIDRRSPREILREIVRSSGRRHIPKVKQVPIARHPIAIGVCRRWLSLALLSLFCVAAALGGEKKWFDTSLRLELLTTEEKAWLEAHPDIRIAGSSSYSPVEFYDKHGAFWGISSEYFNLMEHRLGYAFKFVQLSHEAWQRLDPKERGVDVITASAETPNRGEFWSFTKPYLVFPTYIITRRGVLDELTLLQLKKARVAVVQGWAAEEYLRAQFPEIIVDAVPDTTTGLRKVSFGLVDAFVSELPVATSAMEKEGIANLKIAGEAGYAYELGISVRKDWPELKSILEKALATVTHDEREAICQRWVKMTAPPDYFSARLRRYALWSGAGLLAILAVVLAWNRMLATRVRARTAALREELAQRTKIEEALRGSEERFAKAFRYSPDAMFIYLESGGETIEANEGAARRCAIRRARSWPAWRCITTSPRASGSRRRCASRRKNSRAQSATVPTPFRSRAFPMEPSPRPTTARAG